MSWIITPPRLTSPAATASRLVAISCLAAVAMAAAGAPHAWSASEESAGEYGPSPEIVPPTKSLLPTINVAKAEGWESGTTPRTAKGTAVAAFATGLSHPRWLYVLPNGDVLVAEAEAPPKPDDAKGVGGEMHKLVMKHAGSGAHPSANRITLLRDTRGDGSAVERHIFLQGLNSPIGMVLVGDAFYV